MPALDSSIISKAFGKHADSSLVVAYESHQEASRFLDEAIDQTNRIAMLSGPAGSGKTTIIRELLERSSRETATALIDGEKLTPRQLVAGMLSQYGVRSFSDNNQYLLQQISHFLERQTRDGKPPLLIVDNADRATPSALRQLNWLAALDDRGKYALRIILTGSERLAALLRHDAVRSITRRHPATYSLNPMTRQETTIYLRTRLVAAGCKHAKKIFPMDVCDKLYEVSRGWPGLLNDRATKVMSRMKELQLATPKPRIVVSCDGQTLGKYDLSERQYIIGRTELADIVVDDSYVSKLHAMLRVYDSAVVLLDLNSANGTTVNSMVVQNTILKNNDIIMLGRHRLKIENLPLFSAEMDELINVTDTITMQSVDDLRRSRARRTVNALKRQESSTHRKGSA